MTKFLVTYMGAEPGRMQMDMSEQDNQAFMTAWLEWAGRNEKALVVGGEPVGKTKVVQNGTVQDGKNAITGYSIVEAASHDAAANLFLDHPHTAILNLPIEVMELTAIPGM